MSLEEKITAAVNTYISAFGKGDLEAIMGIYADDCTVEDPVGTDPHVGNDAVRAFYQGAVGMNVTLQLESEIRISGNEAAFAFKGEFETPDGKITFRPIDVMKFNDDGKVVSMRAFWGPSNQGVE